MTPNAPPARIGFRGFFYPLRGLRFLFRHPRLLSYAAVPFAINTILYAAFVWFVGSRFGGWLDLLISRGEGWYWAVLFYALGALFALTLGLVVAYTFTLVGSLLLAPFSDLLSASVEWVYTGHRLDEPFRLGALARDLVRSMKAELGRLALFAAGLVTVLALNLFPPLGTAIAGVLTPLYTLLFLGWEYTDLSMERSRFPFSTKRAVVFRNASALIGFGAGAAVLLFIPLAGFLAIPVCVTGGTLLFCDLRAQGRVPAHPPGETR